MREQIRRSPADPDEGSNLLSRNLLSFVVLLLLLGLPFTALSHADRFPPLVMKASHTRVSALNVIPWPTDGLHVARNLGV